MHLKMSYAKWRQFCLGLNVLSHEFFAYSRPVLQRTANTFKEWNRKRGNKRSCSVKIRWSHVPLREILKVVSFCQSHWSLPVVIPRPKLHNDNQVVNLQMLNIITFWKYNYIWSNVIAFEKYDSVNINGRNMITFIWYLILPRYISQMPLHLPDVVSRYRDNER